MERTTIIKAIRESLAGILEREVPELSEDVSLFDDLELDSTTIMELLMDMEDKVSVEVDPENLEMDDFKSVGTFTDYVVKLRGTESVAG